MTSSLLPSAPVVCESPMHLLELTSCLIYGGLIGDWMAVRGSYSVSSVPYDHRNMHTNIGQLGLCVCMHNIKCLVMSSRGHYYARPREGVASAVSAKTHPDMQDWHKRQPKCSSTANANHKINRLHSDPRGQHLRTRSI